MLEWLLIIEVIALGALAVFSAIARLLAASNENDPMYLFCATFWRNFLWPPMVMELDRGLSLKRSKASDAPKEPSATMTDEDAFYGRVKRDRDGRIVTSTLPLLVTPHCANEQVAGMEQGALKIQVIGEVGDGRTNKALIEIVSNAIGVKPYQVTITKGHYHANKTVQIQGLRPDELDARLGGLA